MSDLEQENKFCQVITTTSSEEDAYKLADLLLTDNLAACIQVTPVSSIFTWQGKTQKETEYKLEIKTQSALYNYIATLLKAHHPYEVPEIICLPIQEGLGDYLAWVEQQTSK
jgi:periplasmic divalent cation tolerance protein